MKRKHAATTGTGTGAAHKGVKQQSGKAAGTPVARARAPTQKQQQAQKPTQQTAFARPMRPLDDDSDEEDAAEDARTRTHRQQIDADNEVDEDDMEEEEEDEDEDDAMEEEDAEADASHGDSQPDDDDEAEEAEEDEEHDANDDEDDVAVKEEEEQEEEEEEEVPLERDFPVQLVQATYSGMLYGLKSREPMRQLQAFQRKLHSKRGIDEADVSDEDEEAEGEGQTDAKATSAAKSTSSGSGASSSFSLLFTTSAHIGSIKSLAVSADGKWMVSGGLDESIKIFKTATMSEHGVLIHHAGSVSCLQFYGSGFLLSGGQEGSLIIWNTKDWSIAKKFEGAHRGVEGSGSAGGVSCIGVHPSGRVALSVGVADRQVKLWDLMKGNMASSRTVDTAFHTVQWSNNGEMYALVGDRRVDIYDTSNTLLRREEVSETKILSAVFLTADLLALGCEDKSIRIHSVHTGECLTTLVGHAARVRGLDALSMPSSAASDAPLDYFIGSASTDGQTHLWELTSLARAAAAAAPNAPAPPSAAFHPICSSAHDQRVVLLKFLPHWRVRKDLPSLLVPVQTKAAEQRQQELMAKKQTKRATGAGAAAAPAAPAGAGASKAPLTKAERAAHTLQKSKALFEKRAAALLKAKRTLAKNSPHASLALGEDDLAAAEAHPRKKVKPTFEEAPQINSDDEEPQTRTVRDEDDDDDEEDAVPAKKAAAPVAPANSKPKLSAAQAKAQTNKKGAATPAAPAAQPSKPQTKAKAKPAAAAAAAAASDSDDEDGAGGDSHRGFSAALPMFKPQLKLQIKKKKKSLKKTQRDAERSRKQR